MNSMPRVTASTQIAGNKARRREVLRSHPSREAIIGTMRAYGRPLSPTQLSTIIGRSLGVTAYHVQALFSAGIVELAGESRRWGPKQRFYALVENTGRTAPSARHVEQLVVLAGATTVPAADGGYPSLATVDKLACAELTEIIDMITLEVRSIAEASTKRARTA
jgi:DNA-binding transcriptional ArsR family regulator